MLDRKADLELINRLQETKATKAQLKMMTKLIEALNVRLKHLSILQAELAKVSVPTQASSSFKAAENINTKIQRRDFLSK